MSNIYGPFYQCGLTLIPAWLSNHMPRNVWDEITYQFPNFNGATIDVWEWISNFIPHFIMNVITYHEYEELHTKGRMSLLTAFVGLGMSFHNYITYHSLVDRICIIEFNNQLIGTKPSTSTPLETFWTVLNEIAINSLYFLHKSLWKSSWVSVSLFWSTELSHLPQATSNGVIELGERWFGYCHVAWWHQTVTWTVFELSSDRYL